MRLTVEWTWLKKWLVSPETHTGNHTSQSTGRKTVKSRFSGPWASMQHSSPLNPRKQYVRQNTSEEILTKLSSNLTVKTEIATHKPRKYNEVQREFVEKQ